MSSSCCCSSSASFSTMSFNLSSPYPILSIILLYDKEAVSCTLCNLYASASLVAATGADTALYNFEIVFLKNVLMFTIGFLRNVFQNFSDLVISYHVIKNNYLIPSPNIFLILPQFFQYEFVTSWSGSLSVPSY